MCIRDSRTLAEHAPVADGVNESAITERYYEPPLINIIKFACHKCLDNKTVVTNMCQGCTAHPLSLIHIQHSVVDAVCGMMLSAVLFYLVQLSEVPDQVTVFEEVKR